MERRTSSLVPWLSRAARASLGSRRLSSLALLGVAGVAGVWATVVAAPTASPTLHRGGPHQPLTVEEAVRAGQHVRLALPQGPVHVWVPAGYHPDGAATVVYVHGYYDTVDEAWSNHRLPEQFALAGLNALFIAPEAPDGSNVPIHFPDLIGLVQDVESRAGVLRGTGPLVAVGHSGAYRTLEKWLAEPLLDTAILVDALYGDHDVFADWLAASAEHRVATVGDDTVRWTEELAAMVPQTVIADRFPLAPDDWTEPERAARHLYVRSQLGHMAQVTEGIALPLLLRWLPVPRLPDTAWHLPVGALPVPWAPALPDVPDVP